MGNAGTRSTTKMTVATVTKKTTDLRHIQYLSPRAEVLPLPMAGRYGSAYQWAGWPTYATNSFTSFVLCTLTLFQSAFMHMVPFGCDDWNIVSSGMQPRCGQTGPHRLGWRACDGGLVMRCVDPTCRGRLGRFKVTSPPLSAVSTDQAGSFLKERSAIVRAICRNTSRSYHHPLLAPFKTFKGGVGGGMGGRGRGHFAPEPASRTGPRRI